MNGSGGEQSVDDSQRRSSPSGLSGQQTPAVRNRLIDNQNSARKASLQLNFQPAFEVRPALALGKGRQPLSNFSQRQNAEIKQGFIGGVEPLDDARLRLKADEFGNTIGVK